MSAILAFKHVSKIYESTQGDSRSALIDASFSVGGKRKVAIVGRSGSGKSTLLHLAAGIDVATSGDVEVMGRNLSDLSEEERTLMRRDEMGLIFQFFYLMPHLTVRDNIALPALIAKQRSREYEPRLRSLLERVGLPDRIDDPVQKLSGGEMQRVAICRALLRRPRLLLADEPTGNLDDENGSMVMQLMLDLVEEEGTTLLYVTHSSPFAELADEVWEIHSGELSTPSANPV
jgi:ABC-type lipoprotein export system ATPase subunit